VDAASREVRCVLPHDAIIVSLLGTPLAATPEPARLLRLVEALLAGDCLVAEPFSLQEAAARAHSKALPVHLSGLGAARSSSKVFRRSAKQREVPVAKRRDVFGPTSLPPAARGQSQPLVLYTYHAKQHASTPDAVGGRQIKLA